MNYVISLNAVKTCDLAVRGGLIVTSFMDCILSEHYDPFRYAAGGQDCRFWIESLIGLLQLRQLTTVGSETQTARAALQSVRDLGGS